MKKIIFCQSQRTADKIFDQSYCKRRYLLLDWNRNSFQIKEILDGISGMREIRIKDYSSWKEQYLTKFTRMMADVNIDNRHQSFWWGMNFTNKNPISTPLCDKIFYSLMIAKIIEECQDDICLCVIGKDNDIFRQLSIWFKNKNVNIETYGFPRLRKDSLKVVIRKYTPAAIVYALLRALWRKTLTPQIKIDFNRNHNVVLSLLNHQSFSKDGQYRDTYFGQFVDYAGQKDEPLINLLFVNSPHYAQMMRKIRVVRKDFYLIPLETFLSFRDTLCCFFISLKKFFKGMPLKGQYDIDGKSVDYLLKATMKRDLHATYFFDNIRIHYEIKRLTEQVNIKRFYYPFENRSFEKLFLKILREFSPRTRIIGYQHPALSFRHTNFLLTPQEHEITPLPDKIMTMGRITKRFMEYYGSFSQELLISACALRQKEYHGSLKAQQKIKNILVILATNNEEYIKVITFLNNALKRQKSFNVWLRPHPVFPLSDAIAIIGQPQFRYYQSDKETLQDCMQWADVALYVHSTAAIECLSRGIPIIYVNIDNVINPDPLYDLKEFRWEANEPQDLTRIIYEINRFSPKEYLEKQSKAVEFTKEYLLPVKEETLKKFLVI